MKDLIERLRDWDNTSDERNRKDMIQAADLLERIYSQPVELPKAVGNVYRYGKDSHGRQWHGIHWHDANVETPDGTTLYTADQLTKAVQEATARALEAAARECEELGKKSIDYYNSASFVHAIRNLIGGVK